MDSTKRWEQNGWLPPKATLWRLRLAGLACSCGEMFAGMISALPCFRARNFVI
jgi:hypothetical protein